MSPVTGQMHMHTVSLIVTAITLMAPVLISPTPPQKDMTGKRPRHISGILQCAMPCSRLTARYSIHFVNGDRLTSRPGAMKLGTRGACLAISRVSGSTDTGVGGLVADSVFSGLGPYCANCQWEQLLDGLRQFLELPRPGHVGDRQWRSYHRRKQGTLCTLGCHEVPSHHWHGCMWYFFKAQSLWQDILTTIKARFHQRRPLGHSEEQASSWL